MKPRTLVDVFFSIVERNSPAIMLRREAIEWVSISSQELYRNVAGVAGALQEWGIQRGDRVAILSENRPEWAIADFASLLLGAVTVPIYPTLTDEQTNFLLRDSGARLVFVSSEKQLQKILSIKSQTAIEMIVVMDGVETAHAVPMYRLMQSGPDQRDPRLDERAGSIGPDDLATIIYTSGTTGVPKGVMLTHGNMASNICFSLEGCDVGSSDLCISFLPLSHVTARHADMVLLNHGIVLAYVSSVEQLPRALREIRPTIFIGVPRVYEKIYSQTAQKTKHFPKSWIYHWALTVGRKHKAEILVGQTPTSWAWKLANRLVYSKIRTGVGGRVGLFISGGAPLGRELATWYATIGIRIHEGYGLTETSPVLALNKPMAHKLGTVGKPLSNVEVRIAEDGEILVRGPSIFKGYWKQSEASQDAFVDGWFRTGDIGNLDAAGFLSVTDRKKDLIKTSGGKYIAPQPIENSLRHNALIAEAAVLGDKHKYPAVLIAPYFPLLQDWAHSNNVAFSSRQELVEHPKVRALFAGIVADLNKYLAPFEKLRRVLVVPDEFSVESETLTASMKLRRRAVEERYRKQIEEMYTGTGGGEHLP